MGRSSFSTKQKLSVTWTAPEPDDLELRCIQKEKTDQVKKNEDHVRYSGAAHRPLHDGRGADGRIRRKRMETASGCHIQNVTALYRPRVEVEEHHIGVYAGKTDEHMVKAPHPKGLLRGSPCLTIPCSGSDERQSMSMPCRFTGWKRSLSAMDLRSPARTWLTG